MININVAGVQYPCPSGPSDDNWASKLVALLKALGAAVGLGPAVQRLSSNVTPVGTGADTTEDTLMTYTLPGGTLAANAQGIRVTAWGDGVSTADVTTLRAYFGGTKVLEKALVANQNNTWRVVFEVFRTSPTAQTVATQMANGGGALNATTPWQQNAAPAETLSGDVLTKFTGQRANSSVANSIRQLGMAVELIP